MELQLDSRVWIHQEWRDWLVNKGTYYKAWQLELDLQNSTGKIGKLFPTIISLTSRNMHTHVDRQTNAYTYPRIHTFKDSRQKINKKKNPQEFGFGQWQEAKIQPGLAAESMTSFIEEEEHISIEVDELKSYCFKSEMWNTHRASSSGT